jgi:putative membrane protein
MVEKMTAINLLLAIATGVKHYLRAEDGIFYEDLYHLVKFLPAYALPTSVPSHVNLQEADNPPTTPTPTRLRHVASDMRSVNSTGGLSVQSHHHIPMQLSPNSARPELGKTKSTSSEHLPLPTLQTQASPRKVRTRPPPLSPISARDAASIPPRIISPSHRTNTFGANGLTLDELEAGLLPARNPPEWGIFDVFPFSLLVKMRTRRGKEMKGKKARRMRAKLRSETVSHNIPLEVSLYLSSYVAALQARKATDPPTTSES